MTCIIGMEKNGVVYIAGDSAGSNSNHDVTVIAEDKIAKRGNLIYGVAGQFRPHQILSYYVDFTDFDEDAELEEFLHQYLIPSFMDSLRDNGALIIEDSEENMWATFLIGYKGKLVLLQRDFGVLSSTNGLLGIGTGGSYALSAVHVLDEMTKEHGIELPPHELLFKAMESAEIYNGGVRRPFIVMDDKGNEWRME